MSKPAALRTLSAAVALGVLAATLAVAAPPAAAATTYSAPLRTAVRQLAVAPETNAGYDRAVHFGDWIDADGDCRNTRHEVLAAESLVPPTSSSTGCTITQGSWRSVYDGRLYSAASELDIDHLVPVAEAWGSGARAWTQAQRIAFYNDLGIDDALNAIPPALNSSKSASGPEAWLPPADQCRYVEMWTTVKHRWRLSVDPAEQAALIAKADVCPNTTLSVPVVVDAPAPPVTPATISGPAQAPRGGTATVAGTAAAGATLQLYTRRQGQAAFALVRTVVADGAGRWSVPYRADVDQLFYAVSGTVQTRTITIKAVGTTLTAPATAQRGSTVTVRGLARPGARVDVWFRAGGTTRFLDLRDLRANSAGAWATTFVAARDYAFYATSAEGRSPVRSTVAVWATISGPATARKGTTVTLTGTARPGARVAVYFRPAGTASYVQRRSLTASSTGAFRTSYTATASQSYYAVANGVRSAVRTTSITAPAPPTVPARPADRDCGDFRTWSEAQAFHDRYFPYYGDVAGLDADGDRIACESLPGAP